MKVTYALATIFLAVSAMPAQPVPVEPEVQAPGLGETQLMPGVPGIAEDAMDAPVEEIKFENAKIEDAPQEDVVDQNAEAEAEAEIEIAVERQAPPVEDTFTLDPAVAEQADENAAENVDENVDNGEEVVEDPAALNEGEVAAPPAGNGTAILAPVAGNETAIAAPAAAGNGTIIVAPGAGNATGVANETAPTPVAPDAAAQTPAVEAELDVDEDAENADPQQGGLKALIKELFGRNPKPKKEARHFRFEARDYALL